MKSLIAIVFLIITQFSFGQDKELPWREGFKLTYSDFEAIPNNNHPFAAITYSGMSYGFSADVINGKVKVDYEIKCYFVANKSWMKMDMADEVLLAHEQLHFDITELFARKFRQELSTMNFTENVKQEIREVYLRVNREKVAMQEEYDEETNHSKRRNKQKEWEIRVAEELQKLNAFASK